MLMNKALTSDVSSVLAKTTPKRAPPPPMDYVLYERKTNQRVEDKLKLLKLFLLSNKKWTTKPKKDLGLKNLHYWKFFLENNLLPLHKIYKD